VGVRLKLTRQILSLNFTEQEYTIGKAVFKIKAVIKIIRMKNKTKISLKLTA
jgi:hypothetical protein